MASARQCLFCDSHDLTREHIWPDWLVELFPKGSYTATQAHSEFGTLTRHAKNITHKARFVCGDCNHGWMSEIEGIASEFLKPVIESALIKRTITVEDQLVLAVWATLRTMVFDTQAHGYYFTQEERVQFSASLKPPPNTHIWIAPHQGRRRAAFHVRALINPVKNSGVEVVTWVMNQLVFQLVTWKGDNRSRIDQASLARGNWPSVTRQIWPSDGDDLWWPPRFYLDKNGLKAIAKRLGGARGKSLNWPSFSD